MLFGTVLKYPRAYTEQASSRLRASAWLLSRKWTHNSSECLQRDEWLSEQKGPLRQEEMGFWGGPGQKRREPAVMRETEAALEGQRHLRAHSTLTPQDGGVILMGLSFHHPLATSLRRHRSLLSFHHSLGAPTLPSHSSLLELCCGRGPQGSMRDVNYQPKLGAPFQHFSGQMNETHGKVGRRPQAESR